MPKQQIDCTCKKRLVIMVPRRGDSFSVFAKQAYENGWKVRNGQWFCSADCVANSAIDITPKTKLIEA